MILQHNQTLKGQLTETVALWGIGFFLLLGLGFYAFFQDIERYLVESAAERQLDIAAAELAVELKRPEKSPELIELEPYTHDPSVAAIALVRAGAITRVAAGVVFPIASNVHDYALLQQLSTGNPAWHLYSRKIPATPYAIALVTDSTATRDALIMTTEFTLLLLMILLLIAIRALHFVLGRRLVQPVHILRAAMEQQSPDAFIDKLPAEVAEALTLYNQLQAQHNLLRGKFLQLMEALPGCFWWSEDGTHYAGLSERADMLLACDPERLIGKALWSWHSSPAQARINRKRLMQAIDLQETGIDFAYQIKQDGQNRWFGETVIITYDHDGKLATIYGIINDISNRKERQQEQAEKQEIAQRMKATATLVGGIAHEFNNALAGMTGNLFLIRQHPDDPNTSVRIDRIETLIDQASGMIDQMLSFALQSNLAPGPIVLADFLETFRSHLLPLKPDQLSLTLDIDSEAADAVIEADSHKLKEALMQLYDNALVATREREQPRIMISLSHFVADDAFALRHHGLAKRDLLRLDFADNGCGMSEEVRLRIFEPFFTTREVGQGTGLGLPMVYGYVKQIGGAIEVESRKQMESRFTLYLPLAAQSNDRQRNMITHGHRETVLIVDDEQIYRDSCCDLLDELGYLPIGAHDGNEGLELYHRHRDMIQLVICDLIMPGMNGIELFRCIRRIDPEIPFLFITGHDQTFPNAPEIFDGHVEMLDKPFHIPELSQAIERAIKSRHPAPGHPDS